MIHAFLILNLNQFKIMAVATGDFHNNYETLKKELRSVKYPHPLNDEDV